MTKKEINKAICSMTDDQIEDFVKKRIQELEEESTETVVGQDCTTVFREYISEKTHFKAGPKLKNRDFPDLVYDDITPYINLIKEIRKNSCYYELTLFTTILAVVLDYLPSDRDSVCRAATYLWDKSERVSIKQVRNNKCAVCVEKSGMAHNMLKFLGVDSEVVIGYRNTEAHAYTIVYPFGYGNEPMVIYDPSFYVVFTKKGQEEKKAYGYFKAMRREDYEKLMSGLPVKMELSKTEENYRRLYDLGDEYVFEGDTPTYIAGLEHAPTEPS